MNQMSQRKDEDHADDKAEDLDVPESDSGEIKGGYQLEPTSLEIPNLARKPGVGDSLNAK
jgi:hypothetical protein